MVPLAHACRSFRAEKLPSSYDEDQSVIVMEPSLEVPRGEWCLRGPQKDWASRVKHFLDFMK